MIPPRDDSPDYIDLEKLEQATSRRLDMIEMSLHSRIRRHETIIYVLCGAVAALIYVAM